MGRGSPFFYLTASPSPSCGKMGGEKPVYSTICWKCGGGGRGRLLIPSKAERSFEGAKRKERRETLFLSDPPFFFRSALFIPALFLSSAREFPPKKIGRGKSKFPWEEEKRGRRNCTKTASRLWSSDYSVPQVEKEHEVTTVTKKKA